MKSYFCIWLALASSTTVVSDDGSKWLRLPPASAKRNGEHAILITEVFEVVASKLSAATHGDLGKSAIVGLTPGRAKYFTGEYYHCSTSRRPYLVRAVYGLGGTGVFRVKQVGQSLVVTHESIGEEISFVKSALIVNLDFEPTEVYVVASIVR